MTTAVVVLDLLIVGFLIHRFRLGVLKVMRWPDPIPRPYVCDKCLRAYRDTRTLSLHVRGEHPDTFDGG